MVICAVVPNPMRRVTVRTGLTAQTVSIIILALESTHVPIIQQLFDKKVSLLLCLSIINTVIIYNAFECSGYRKSFFCSFYTKLAKMLNLPGMRGRVKSSKVNIIFLVWTCPENHPFIYEDGTMCCAEQPVDEMTCNADNSGCPPRIPSLLCSDHPTAVRVEVEVDNHGKKSKIIKLKLNQTSH